ncbi:MAG: hypothetical protein KJO17_12075 [Acidimicrobiia bacterium]|nr:hypothetical protein [Acidimicrobiia bacterium]
MESDNGPVIGRRKLIALIAGTVLLVISYAGILGAFVASGLDDGPNPGPPLALGMALLPIVFAAVAYLSLHPRAGTAVLKAVGLFFLFAVPISALAQDAVTGLVAGFGAGAVVTVDRLPMHTWKSRAIAVGASVFYVFVLVRIVPPLGVASAPLLPFTAVAMADYIAEQRTQPGNESAGGQVA